MIDALKKLRNVADREPIVIPGKTSEEVRNSIVDQIRLNFSDLLDKEDLKLLDGGMSGLEKIGEKYRKKFQARKKEKESMIKSALNI